MLKQLNLLSLLSLLCLLMLTSCSMVKRQYGHVGTVKPFSPKDYHQVLTTMGAPDSIAVLNDAFIFAYHSVTIDEPQLGLAIPSFDFFKFTLGSATAIHNYHFYAFSLQGKTINLQQNYWQNALGDSSTIGLIFVVEETVDLTSFETPRAANLWGERLLFDIDLIEFSFQDIILARRLDLIGQDY
ncbi:hypothetical protein [Colwellia psychrerythraea]|uniref:Lipoprotein n=1 Tax=Colwellia psychrerythraea TaxID=28229 RepID=A0A099KRJ9_COLPS|nr:hypothetical protein [Colwellia psychrerythraea]KGJ92283.1 hypothetical protein GAB14E_2871 [Colwellia psychrerythraea]